MMAVRRCVGVLALSLGLSAASWAQVSGTVKLDGEAPEMKELDMSAVKECAQQHPDPVYEESVVVGEDGGLANVIVSIKPADGQELKGEAKKAVIDQKGCQYTPHVVAMMAGDPLTVKNSDPFLHNVHGQPSKNPGFNLAQQNKNEGDQVKNLKTPEVFHVKCDVHPWMSAYVGVFPHPFYAVTNEKGAFELPQGLKDGSYSVVAWHEKYGSKEGKVEVKDGKGTVDFTYKAAGAQAEPSPVVKEVRLAANKAGEERRVDLTQSNAGCEDEGPDCCRR